jgi:CRISPR/Cas system-associated exonuclease Cas4 (RecB family)
VEIPQDEEVFLSFIRQVLDLLSRPEPPEANPECTFCSYREAARNTAF